MRRANSNWSNAIKEIEELDKKEIKEKLINTKIEKHESSLLLMPPLVKPLHGIAPREIKGEDWWYATRNEVYKKNNYHCLACGVHKSNAKLYQWLEAHEYYEVDYINTKYTLKDIISLCHCCHAFIHYQRTTAMLDNNKITKNEFDIIMKHGKTILEEINANKDNIVLPEDHFPENNGKWKEWYLDFEGKKYYSKFNDLNEWIEYYDNLNKNK